MSTQLATASVKGGPFVKGNRVYSPKLDQDTKARFAQPEDMGTAFALIEMNMGSFMLLEMEALIGEDLNDSAEMTILAARGLYMNGLLEERVAIKVADWFDGDCASFQVFTWVMERVAIAKLRSGPMAMVYGKHDIDGRNMAAAFVGWHDMPVERKRHAMSHLLYRHRSSTDEAHPLRCAIDQLDFKLCYELPELPNYWKDKIARQTEQYRREMAELDYESDEEIEVTSPIRKLWRSVCWTNRVLTRGYLYGMAFKAGMQSSRWGNPR